MPSRADRLDKLPPYLFVEIDRKKSKAKAEGRDIIDFGVGDPDMPTPDFIVKCMSRAVAEPGGHRYPKGRGSDEFRAAVARYLQRRYGVSLDPERQIIALIGSKEGIGHLPTAVVNPGDSVLIPEPGYPVYTGGTIFAGGRPETMQLTAETGWLPDLQSISSETAGRSRLMFLNYPNNPTSACASIDFFREAVEWARNNDVLLAHDAAYAEVYFNEPPPSIMQIDGAHDCCVEFHSLSKTFNMTGWRIAFAVGNAEVLAALAAVKDNLDSGPFTAVQNAAIEALGNYGHPDVLEQVEVYRRRRDILIGGLREAGWPAESPQATFFAWTRCPAGLDSMTVTGRLLDETGVVVVPGAGFGETARGFVRFALTVEEQRTREAVERIAGLSW